MYILGIDTSTERLSIAINNDLHLLSKIEFGKNQKYMTGIISLVDKALKKSGLSLDLIDIFAVNIGPGDFTGTRIGITVAKTLAWVRNKPILGIGSLEITALDLLFGNLRKIRKFRKEGKRIIIIPVLDVKRDEVFFSFFKVSDVVPGEYFLDDFSGCYLAKSEDMIKKIRDSIVLLDFFPSSILTGGSGFSSYKHLSSEVKELGSGDLHHSGLNLNSFKGVSNNPHTGINIILDKGLFYPDAYHLNLCAYYSFLKNGNESIKKDKLTGEKIGRSTDYGADDYSLAPLYVREFIPFKK